MCTTFFFSVGFREGIKDQQLVAIAVQNMVKTHEGASDSLFEAKTRLTHLQEKKAAMEGDSAQEDKVAALDGQRKGATRHSSTVVTPGTWPNCPVSLGNCCKLRRRR